ncbi:MAG TPA: hypothetical protein VFM95_01490 [Microcella sp.]|nr:hypothetical protein [Microcella sp.]
MSTTPEPSSDAPIEQSAVARPADPALIRGLRAAMSAQRPAVIAHIRSIRQRHPGASPDDVVRILEKRYLAGVTATGAGSGAATMIPGVGTAAGLAVIGVETVTFFEMTALYAQSVAEVHGIVVADEEHAHTLVMALLLGGPGKDLVQQFLRQASGTGPNRQQYWGETVSSSLPKALTGALNSQLRDMFVKRFALAQGGSMLGRLIPFGIGAIIGGSANRTLGGRVVDAARGAFGPAPATFPAGLEPVLRPPKAPKAPRAPRKPTAPRAIAAVKRRFAR